MNSYSKRNQRLCIACLDFERATGFPISLENGQLIAGPRPTKSNIIPPKNSEVFVGNLPKNLNMLLVYQLFRQVGEIYQIRFFFNFEEHFRGFAFVGYMRSESARRAIQELNGYRIHSNHEIQVQFSVNNCRLFLAPVPGCLTYLEIYNELELHVDGLARIIVYPAKKPTYNVRNRGYIFLEFDCHKSAAIAKRHLNAGIMIWNEEVFVDWADSFPNVESDIMNQFANRMWRRFVSECLPDLLLRSKWFNKADPLQIGDVVLIVDSNLPCCNWPKGKVVLTKLVKDGQVRGLYERPTVKVVKLDIKKKGTAPPSENAVPGGSVTKGC